jgi:hypothetical protein
MPITLNPPAWDTQRVVLMNIAFKERGALPFMKEDRHFVIALKGDDVTPDNRRLLTELGFLPIANEFSEMADLRGFESRDAYLATISVQGRYLKRGLRLLPASAQWSIRRCAEIPASEWGELYERMILPFTSVRHSPYFIYNAERFMSRLSKYSHDGFSLLLLRVDGAPAVGMFLRIERAESYYGQKGYQPDRDLRWSRPVARDELVMSGDVSVVSPMLSQEFGSYLPDLLYWQSLEYAIENGCSIFCMGIDERFVSSEQYMGVLAFKKKWGSRTGLFWKPRDALYLRLAHEALLSEGLDTMYFRGTPDSPGAEHFLFSNGSEPEYLHLMELNAHLEKRVFVPAAQLAKWKACFAEVPNLTMTALGAVPSHV